MGTGSLIDSPNLKVWKTTGTEGPAHDPYLFEEYEIRRYGSTYTIHAGLSVWARLDRGDKHVMFNPNEKRNNLSESQFVDFVAKWACGYTLTQLERFSRKAKSRCRCGSRSFERVAGYPGEHMTACRKCHSIVASTFNEGAVI